MTAHDLISSGDLMVFSAFQMAGWTAYLLGAYLPSTKMTANANRSQHKRIIKMIGGFIRDLTNFDYKSSEATEIYLYQCGWLSVSLSQCVTTKSPKNLSTQSSILFYIYKWGFFFCVVLNFFRIFIRFGWNIVWWANGNSRAPIRMWVHRKCVCMCCVCVCCVCSWWMSLLKAMRSEPNRFVAAGHSVCSLSRS